MPSITEAVAEHGSIRKAADALGIARSTLRARMAKEKTSSQLVFPKLSDPNIPVDELIRRRGSDFKRTLAARNERKLIKIKVKCDGPIGLAVFGDPHTDDDGTDLDKLMRDAHTVRKTDGLFGINVGDNQNLWPGRLAALYAEQTMRASDGWRVTEHFLKTVGDKWLCLVKGNHDHFQGGGDPLDWLFRGISGISAEYDVRIALVFPNGREYRLWLRHDFAGHSMWNNVHGLVKKARSGARFHLYLAGHKHCSGYHSEYDDESGILWHAVRTTSYKVIDSYADEHGFQDDNIFQCPIVVIDPEATTPGRFTQVLFDTDAGADYLKFLRRKSR